MCASCLSLNITFSSPTTCEHAFAFHAPFLTRGSVGTASVLPPLEEALLVPANNRLKRKEAMHFHWEKPNLNQQVNYACFCGYYKFKQFFKYILCNWRRCETHQNMFYKLKNVVILLKIAIDLLLSRPNNKIIYLLANKNVYGSFSQMFFFSVLFDWFE